MNPYFSICIPTTNRGKTIYETLCSVANQSFRDFQLIIVDCGSSDNTRNEIERFFNSAIYQNNQFKYVYETRDYVPKTVEDWNEPIKMAQGKYIAMLEGDDQFLPNHLENAFKYLNSNPRIGVYASSNQYHIREKTGIIESKEWISYSISCNDVPPPSEAIFIRLNNDGTPFLYNDRDYEYAPEADLYVRLSLAGFDTYHSDNREVFRDVSTKKRKTWHFFVDRFTLLNKYKESISSNTYNIILKDNLSISILAAFSSKTIPIIANTLLNIARKQSIACVFVGIASAIKKYVVIKRH